MKLPALDDAPIPSSTDTAVAARPQSPSPAAALKQLLASLDTMNLMALREVWSENFGMVPSIRSPELLRSNLAWRFQARLYGGLDAATKRKLGRTGAIQTEGLNLGVGTKLKREWQGIAYEVIVEEDGFRWNGKIHPSLSAVATAITGTRWNGPRFFGLRKAA